MHSLNKIALDLIKNEQKKLCKKAKLNEEKAKNSNENKLKLVKNLHSVNLPFVSYKLNMNNSMSFNKIYEIRYKKTMPTLKKQAKLKWSNVRICNSILELRENVSKMK